MEGDLAAGDRSVGLGPTWMTSIKQDGRDE
jgi:hypothetical protein